MQNKRGVAIAALIVIASMMVLFCSGVSALASLTIYVDDQPGGADIGTQYAPFHTISKALKEAKSGDTIIVAAGNYVQTGSITIANLTILGPNAGVSAGVNPGDRGDEAVIDSDGVGLTIDANNLIFDGFKVQIPGMTIKDGKSGSVIANNVFDGAAGESAISLGTNSNITIKNNIFDNWNIGIDSSKSTNLSITGNVFWNNNDSGVKLSGSTLSDCSGNAFRDNHVGFYADGVAQGLALHSNAFEGNLWRAVENGDPYDPKTIAIDARNNWWGDSSGPSWAGPGSGDPVSRSVLFDPWLIYNVVPWFPPGILPTAPTGDPETDVIDETLRAQVVKPGQKNVVVQQVVIKDPGEGVDKIGDRHPTDISIVRITAKEALAEQGRIDKLSLVVDSNKNGTYEPGQDVVLAYRTLAFVVNWFVQTDSVTFGVRDKKLLQVPDNAQVRLFVVVDISPTAVIGERLHTSVSFEAEDNLSAPGSVSSNFETALRADASFDTIVAFASGDKEANLIDETKSASIINGQKKVVIQEFVLQDPGGGIDSTADDHPTWISTVVVRSTAGSTITADDIAEMWVVRETDGIPGYSIDDVPLTNPLTQVSGQGFDLDRDGVRFGDPLSLTYPFITSVWQEDRFYIVANFNDTLKDGDWLKVETKVTTSDPYNVPGIDPNNPYYTKSSDIENPVLVASNGVVMGAASGSGIPKMKGDVNGDGKVDVSDVRLVSRYILKVTGATLSAAQKVAGDVAPPHIPPDTNLDVTDVRWLSQAALGLKTLSAKAANVNSLAITTPAKLEIDQNGRLNVSGTSATLTDLQGRLLFDPAVLHVSEVIGLNGFTVLASTIDNDKGEVRFIVANLSTQPVLGRSVIQFVTSGDPTQAVVYMEVLRDVQARNVPYQFLGRLGNLEFGHAPNPVTAVHTATFEVKGPMAALVETIKVQIFNLSGRLVYESGEVAGTRLDWHTDNNNGEYLANGVYLYKLYALINDQWVISETKKLVILR